jgi:hypothetical protein
MKPLRSGAAVLIAIFARLDIRHTDTSLSDVPDMHTLGIQVAYNASARLNCIAAKCPARGAVLGVV